MSDERLNLNVIKARSEAMRMLSAGIAPYSSGFGDPARDFWEHAPGDIEWLIAEVDAASLVIEILRPHLASLPIPISEALSVALGRYDWRHDG
jgi:hypothetical protein